MKTTDSKLYRVGERLLRDEVLTATQWGAVLANIEQAGLVIVDDAVMHALTESVRRRDEFHRAADVHADAAGKVAYRAHCRAVIALERSEVGK